MNGTITKRSRKDGSVSWGFCLDTAAAATATRRLIIRSGYATREQAEEALRAATTRQLVFLRERRWTRSLLTLVKALKESGQTA